MPDLLAEVEAFEIGLGVGDVSVDKEEFFEFSSEDAAFGENIAELIGARFESGEGGAD